VARSPLGRPADILKEAIGLHQAGRLDEAEARYRRVLKAAPNATDAHHMLGVLAHQKGRTADAVRHLRRAIQLNPRDVVVLRNLGTMLQDSGAVDDAIAVYRQALSVDPRDIGVLNNLGNALRSAGRLVEAEATLRRLVEIAPGFTPGHDNLGVVLAAAGQWVDAIACYHAALARAPDVAGTHFNLGRALDQSGDEAGAEEAYGRAVALASDFAEALNSLGALDRRRGRIDAAIGWFRRAVAAAPDGGRYHANLANALAETQRWAEAAAAFETALARGADTAETWNNLGALQLERHRLDAALAAFARAIALDPALVAIYLNRAHAHHERRDLDAAIGDLERALAIEPGNASALAHLAVLLSDTCAWDRFEAVLTPLRADTADALARGAKPAEPPYFTVRTSDDPALLLAVARAAAADLERRIGPVTANTRRDRVEGPLRIGYLSRDFRNHPMTHLIGRILAIHDRARVHVTAYALGADEPSDYRRRIVESADRFVDIDTVDDETAARRIADDGIDILVDLMGFTAGHRLGILARRPAPVQASYVGFAGSCGARFIDYAFVDRVVAPPGEAAAFTERLVRLPHFYMWNDRSYERDIPPTTRAAHGLPDEAFVFASFNHPGKIDRATFAAWAAILRAVPGSVLWVLDHGPTTSANLAGAWRGLGMEPARLLFAPKLPKLEHLARLGMADLMLDTRIFNGHTTTCDALWAGLPVLTIEGRAFAGRVSASALRVAGLPELVTTDEAAFIARGIALASDRTGLAALRARLIETRETNPLTDGAGYARSLECAFAVMWRPHAAGLAPDHIDVVETGPGSG